LEHDVVRRGEALKCVAGQLSSDEAAGQFLEDARVLTACVGGS
jgi:hypothetical protein